MDALVLSCGGTVEPLVESIKEYKPYLVYFLHSEQSFYQAMYILSIFNFDLIYNCKLVKNYQNLDEVFLKSREIISELKEKDYDIRVDFTGGTKTMSAGLVLSSIGQGCKHSYIGSKDLNGRDKSGLGVVLDGHELITEQEDPYGSYAILEFERGKLFFDNYQFKAAKINFEDAKDKSKSENLKKLADVYLGIVNLYDLWDKFDIKKSKNVMLNTALNALLKNIKKDENIFDNFLKEYPHFIGQMEINSKFLERKISDKKLINSENINYYLPDLLNNAQRRIDEGKYDDAIARLYRSIELIAQIELTRLGFIDEKILSTGKVFKIKKSAITNLPYDSPIKSKVMSWHEFKKESSVFKVGLYRNYILLNGLDVDFAKKYLKDDNIQNKINLRNESILAHGLKRIKDKKAEELMDQVLIYARYICPNVDELMQQAKFPKFNF